MTLNYKNQNDIIISELIDSYNIEYIFENKPINRIKTKASKEDKNKLLGSLKKKIENIENCELKKMQKIWCLVMEIMKAQ